MQWVKSWDIGIGTNASSAPPINVVLVYIFIAINPKSFNVLVKFIAQAVFIKSGLRGFNLWLSKN